MSTLRNFFKNQTRQETIKSISLIVCVTAVFLLISFQNKTSSTDEGFRHLNGEFRSVNIGEKNGCSFNDSLSFSYEITPPFGEDEFKISMRIDSSGHKSGMVYSSIRSSIPDSNNVEFSQVDSIKIDSIPVDMLSSIVKLMNNYVQDSTKFLPLDGENKVATLCDRKSGKETTLSIIDVDDAPHAIELNDSLKRLILLSIPKSQQIGSVMQYYGK